MTTDRSRRVIMLIDYDNLQICASRDAPGTDLDLHAVMELAQSYGTVMVARAYAEWNMAAERLAVYKAGIEPIFAPVLRTDSRGRVEGKSLCDTVMVAEGVDLLWTLSPDVLVLVTSDKDLIPLARVARQRGASVVVIGSDLTAVQLVEMCNVLITYRQLLKDLGKSPDAAPPSTPSRGTRERGRGIADRAVQERERERPVIDRRPRDRDRDRDRERDVFTPAAVLPPVVAEPLPLAAIDLPSDDFGRADDFGADESPAAARRRRRRRGRTRTDDGLGEGGELPLDSVADTYEPNGREHADAPVALMPVAEISEPPSVNGQVDEVPSAELSDDQPAPRAPRRRRRPAVAVADAPSESTDSES
ncbi:MAG: NYN domain-containing protein [Chloroflexota bacterium]